MTILTSGWAKINRWYELRHPQNRRASVKHNLKSMWTWKNLWSTFTPIYGFWKQHLQQYVNAFGNTPGNTAGKLLLPSRKLLWYISREDLFSSRPEFAQRSTLRGFSRCSDQIAVPCTVKNDISASCSKIITVYMARSVWGKQAPCFLETREAFKNKCVCHLQCHMAQYRTKVFCVPRTLPGRELFTTCMLSSEVEMSQFGSKKCSRHAWRNILESTC